MAYATAAPIITVRNPNSTANTIARAALITDMQPFSPTHPCDFVDGQPAGERPLCHQGSGPFFETGSNRQIDVMVTVAADEAVRIQRIMERDGVAEQQVRERMENQWPQEEKIKHSDFVIRNNPGDFLIPQVVALHRSLVAQ